jgi:hypothetical protein
LHCIDDTLHGLEPCSTSDHGQRCGTQAAHGQSHGIAAAFAFLKPYTNAKDTEFQAWALHSQAEREKANENAGKSIGSEFISQKKIGDSLVRLTYIEKTAKTAFVWNYYFYKSPTGWLVNSLTWNQDLQLLFNSQP